MTPMERRSRISEIAESDTEYQKMMAEYESARTRFEGAVKWMPARLRNLLWCFPGMGYFVYHRMLSIVCEHMIFPDEISGSDTPDS